MHLLYPRNIETCPLVQDFYYFDNYRDEYFATIKEKNYFHYEITFYENSFEGNGIEEYINYIFPCNLKINSKAESKTEASEYIHKVFELFKRASEEHIKISEARNKGFIFIPFPDYEYSNANWDLEGKTFDINMTHE